MLNVISGGKVSFANVVIFGINFAKDARWIFDRRSKLLNFLKIRFSLSKIKC